MNKKKLTLLITMTFILAFASFIISAETLLSGECNSFEFPNSDNVTLEIIGNSSNMDGFSWSQNSTNIIYCFDKAFKPDNFTLRFYNYQSVDVPSSSSGGGGSVKIIPKFDVEQGIDKLLSKGSIFYFTISEKHKFTVLDVTSKNATFKVESTAQIFTLNINESIDLNLDNSYLRITLEGIKSKSYADISMKLIDNARGNGTIINQTDQEIPSPNEEPQNSEDKDNATSLSIAIMIFIIVVVIIYKLKSKEENGKNAN